VQRTDAVDPANAPDGRLIATEIHVELIRVHASDEVTRKPVAVLGCWTSTVNGPLSCAGLAADSASAPAVFRTTSTHGDDTTIIVTFESIRASALRTAAANTHPSGLAVVGAVWRSTA
jgi:hypothetical protein